MLKAIIVIVILTWAYLVYLLIRLHRLINRAYKGLEEAPEPESTEEAIQKEFAG